MKTQSKKGFTLIELMIVVAIIGVLAVTIVPALTGAQARARDAGRVAGLQNISAVLETYYSDVGSFPLSNTTAATADDTGKLGCISDKDGNTADDLEKMFKGGKSPLNPQKTSTSASCAEQGAYAYYALKKNDVKAAGYILIADVESAQKANASLTGSTDMLTDGATDTFEDQVSTFTSGTSKISWGKVITEPTGTIWTAAAAITGAKASVFALGN